MDKKKSADPNIKECTNCGTSGAGLTCGECKAAHYCSKACQKQHWKNGHKGTCIAPEMRRPQNKEKTNNISSKAAAENQAGESAEACTICLELLSDSTLCTLPCEHEFHQDCVEALRKLGVLQACPLCRADLPDVAQDVAHEGRRPDAATPTSLSAQYNLLAYCGWYSFFTLKSQLQFLNGRSSSLKFEPVGPDGPFPFVFVINKSLVVLVVLSSVAFQFFWLVRHSSDTNIDMLRTDRERIARFVDPIAVASIGFAVAAIVAFSVTWNGQNADGTTVDRMFTVFYALGLGFTPAPFCAVATLYYAETRRLRFMIKDFAALVKRKPFNFSSVGPAYKELLFEFDDLNSRMGVVLSVMVAALLALLGFISIELYYWNVTSGYLLTALVVVYAILIVACSALTVGAQIGANRRSNDLAVLCTSLLCTIDPSQFRPLEALLTCIQSSPCELLLFGNRITKSDIAYLVGFFVSVQSLRFLGLSNIAGQ